MSITAARPTRLLSSPFSRTLALSSFAALGMLLLWLTAPVFASLHPYWVQYGYSHGYLVLAMTAWLILREIRRAPFYPLSGSWLGFACFSALMLATAGARAASVSIAAQAALPALVASAIWACAGARNARRFVLPLAYAYFAIPVWDVFVRPLQSLTVLVVSQWLRVANVPAFIDGNLIHLASGTFEVQGGCAGLHYAIVAVALASFCGILYHRRRGPVLILLTCAVGLALFTNWLRVFTIVVAGYLTDMQHFLIARDHDFFGWSLFVVFIAPLFYLDRVLQRSHPQSRAEHVATAVAGSPVVMSHAAITAVCAALALGIWLNHRIDQRDEAWHGTVALPMPEIDGWSRIAEWRDVRRPYFVGATAEAASWYTDGAVRIGAYVAHYAAQQQGREIVFAHNRAEGRSGDIVERRAIDVAVRSGAELPFQEVEISDQRGRRVVWIGMRVAGKWAADRLTAKALQLVGAVRGRWDAQAFVMTTDCEADCSNARAHLRRFALIAVEPLQQQAERLSGAQTGPATRGGSSAMSSTQ